MFNVILAMDKNRGLGNQGQLVWQLKKDMAFFKSLTTSQNLTLTETEFGINRIHTPSIKDQKANPSLNSVIMGRKTWESIPEKFRPLKNRENIVLSRSKAAIHPQVKVVPDFEQSLVLAGQSESETFVIGGGQLYRQSILHPKCQRIYITQIEHAYTCDTYFPSVPEYFKLQGRSGVYHQEEVSFTFLIYENQTLK